MPIETINRFKPLMRMRGLSDNIGEERNKKRRLFFSEDNKEQRYVVIKKLDSDNSFKGVSPFLIEKGLMQITEYIKETQRLRNGDLLVLSSKEEGTKALLKSTKMANMPISVEEHKYLNVTKGVIYSYDLMNLDTEEITRELSSQKVVKAERIKRRINGELKDTPLHILTFDTTELPTNIKAGFLRLDVRLYLPNPMRCHNCQKYGHTKNRCVKIPVCPKCARQIPNGHEIDMCKSTICANCEGQHTTFDKNCPSFQMEKAIIKIKTMDRITYFRAKEIYIRENANTTGALTINSNKKSYSEILKENGETANKTNNTKQPTTNNIQNINNTIENNNNNKNDNINNDNNNNMINLNKYKQIKETETISNNEVNKNQIIEKPKSNRTNIKDDSSQEKRHTMMRKYNLLSPAELSIAIDVDDCMDE